MIRCVAVNAKPCQILQEMILEAAEIRDSQTSSSDADQVPETLAVVFLFLFSSKCHKNCVRNDTGCKSVKCKQSRRVSVYKVPGTILDF